MDKKILSRLLSAYYKKVEENFVEGHYIETDFLHYSELVKILVKTPKHQDIFFVTGLCLPLFVWFNFNVMPPRAISVRGVSSMETNEIWVNYLKFIRSLVDDKVDLYRYIICIGDDVEIDEKFELVYNDIYKAQCNSSIIYKKEAPIDPLTGDKIRSMLLKLRIDYPCYSKTKKAYLIVDKSDIMTKNNEIETDYGVENLGTFFVKNFHKTPNHIKKTILIPHWYSWLKDRSLPEDFFLVYSRTSPNNNPNMEFLLCADVVSFEKVTLWMTSPTISPKIKDSQGKYAKRFKIEDFRDFLEFIMKSENSMDL